jgi:hypothetical protein
VTKQQYVEAQFASCSEFYQGLAIQKAVSAGASPFFNRVLNCYILNTNVINFMLFYIK